MSETQIEAARHNMVVSQIRTWDVRDDRLLEILERAPRQNFVPAEFRNLAFADMQIPLGDGEVMMAPLVEARLIQALAIKPTDSVLEIGTGSGFVTWLLAQLAAQVRSVEIRGEFTQRASEKLAAHGARNVDLEIGDGARGWSQGAPYDAIFVTGSLPLLTDEFRKQLKVGGRLAVIVGMAPVMEARLITRVNELGYDSRSLFETAIPPLRNAPAPDRFVF
jgi:protein-L-isoaspartate(D-aspartate) O-methyltransferase